MIRTYRVMIGFALNYGPYTDVYPGQDVDLPDQIARHYPNNLAQRTGQTASPAGNPDVIVTRDPIPAKIAAAGGGKRRK